MQNRFHEKIVLSLIPFLIPLNNLITFKNDRDQILNTVKFESNIETSKQHWASILYHIRNKYIEKMNSKI